MKSAAKKSWKEIKQMIPLITGFLLIIALLSELVPKAVYSHYFTGGATDLLVGTAIGSISFGNPVTSYVIGGELISQGISLAAVTAFMVAWVTVGSIQFPIEKKMFGMRFAVVRNIVAFATSIAVAWLTVLTVGGF